MSTVIPKEHLNTLYLCCFEFLQDSAIIFHSRDRTLLTKAFCTYVDRIP